MNITILTDNRSSWIVEYIPILLAKLDTNHNVKHVYSVNELEGGDILCALSCERIIKPEFLNRFKSTVVAHPSPLPKGKGWSPVAWQILEGKNKIPVSLIEADDKLDSGVVYFQKYMEFNGSELNNEIKEEQFRITADLVLKYCDEYPVHGKVQIGQESFYRKLTKEDNRLDIYNSIESQFNRMRVADNERYPCWFEINGQQYEILIRKK